MDDDLREQIARAIEAEADGRAAMMAMAESRFPGEGWNVIDATIRALRLAAQIARETSPWIPVAERAPEPGQLVLAHSGAREFGGWPARYLRGGFHDPVFGGALPEVTHWMPEPRDPEADDGPAAEYRRLTAELDALIARGLCDSPEADAVRDRMEAPWYAMTEAERDGFRGEGGRG